MTTPTAADIRAMIESAVGHQHVSIDTARYVVDGVSPKLVAAPDDIEHLARLVKVADSAGLAIVPWGGGTRMTLGNRVERYDIAVVTTRLRRIIAHNSGDMTATVEAGITIDELQKALGLQGQFLAIDPPMPSQATLGGTLAASINGPLKWQYGHLRDVVIGMKVVQANGAITKSGGQVVKNVSGYDMVRLHIGALGTLGIIAEVSLKLTPTPRQESTVIASFPNAKECFAASMALFNSYVMPLAMTALDGDASRRAGVGYGSNTWHLIVRLGGRPRTIARQVDDCVSVCRAGGASNLDTLDAEKAQQVWRAVADFGWDADTTPVVAARAFVKPEQTGLLVDAISGSAAKDSLATVSHPAFGTAHLHWYDTAESDAPGLIDMARSAAHRAGGKLIVDRCPTDTKTQIDVWDEIGAPIETMRRMKKQYDPNGIINPGRFVRGI